jgi:hypothetical protein
MGRMSAIGGELQDAHASGADVEALCRCAATLLTDADFLQQQLAEPDARVAEARAVLALLDADAAAAWRRYPAVGSGGFHSGQPDPRPFLIAWTAGYVREAGFYTADELERLQTAGEVTSAWMAAESLRLCAFLTVLGTLIDELHAGAVRPSDYTASVKDLARKFGRMPVERSPRVP